MHDIAETPGPRLAGDRSAKDRRPAAGRPRLQPTGAAHARRAPTTPRLACVNFKGAFNVNGNRTFNNVFLLDGVENISYSNSFRGENVQLVQPSVDALQEFKIQTNA